MYYIARTSYTFLILFITLPFLLHFFISIVFSTCYTSSGLPYNVHSTDYNIQWNLGSKEFVHCREVVLISEFDKFELDYNQFNQYKHITSQSVFIASH